MELDNLIEQSTFLNKYKYLLKLYKPEELNLSVILGHYRRKLNIFFLNDYPTKSNIENFKNEIIFLIFVSFHSGNINQEEASRLWSLICKNILSKIFHYYLFAKYKDYKKYFFVIGMGKIGVKDLNFTSDIDLIIFFDSKNSPYELYEFNKSIKTLISDISNISPTFFHKIDLRLRPDLGNSFIVTDMEDAIDYYSSVGRNWERLAFHRSCFLCGDIGLYSNFISSISSFLFRRSFDYYAIDEVKKLFSIKHDPKSLDIKNSYGFIRSCENIIHFNQLLWSGKFIELRENNIHKLFNILSKYDFIINSKELIAVKNSYYFFRKIENYLHIKQNIFQNIVSADDNFLKLSVKDYVAELQAKSHQIINIFEKLFTNDGSKKDINYKLFNDKSIKIIEKLFDRADKINSSDIVKEDYTKSINHLIAILSEREHKDELLIKFDYLINYYKSGVHLTSLSKYNQNIFIEIIFIFQKSPKLTNLLYKNNFLIESLVYLFNYGLPEYQTRNGTDNFDLDLKKMKQDLYEITFLLDYLYISNKVSTDTYITKRNRTLRKFIYNLFEIVKFNYLCNKEGVYSDLTPLFFGSFGIKQALPSSDIDMFFIYESDLNDHIHNIKIVRRFYNIVNQYIDKNVVFIDDRNKPFDKSSDQVINIDKLFAFYRNTNEVFHQLSFIKIHILTKDKSLLRKFNLHKKNITSQFLKIDKKYIRQMIELKSPLKILKDLFQIFKIANDIYLINNKELGVDEDLKKIRNQLILHDLESSPSKIDNKKYLDELLLKLD